MTQQVSPFLETAYGWAYGENGWNAGMDSNLLKFSFLFNGNVNGVVSALPAAVDGEAYYLTSDSRLYFCVGTTWYSSPTPRWFQFRNKNTGVLYEYNGTFLSEIQSPTQLGGRITALETTVNSLGTAAFQDVSAFATQSALDVAVGQAQAYTDTLRGEIESTKGSSMVIKDEQVCNSISELRGLDKTSPSKYAFVSGYYSAGDGGGGHYYLDASDTTTPDDGGSVIVSSDNARWKLQNMQTVSVRQFGAKGDGITDDTVAIQKALSAVDTKASGRGGVVYFPQGDYLLSATLVAKANTHMAGVGSRIGCRLVRYTDYGHTVTCGDDSIGAQGFKCTDLEFFHGGTFNGTEATLPNKATYGAHLYLRGGNMAFIERCHFYRMQYNIVALGGAWIHIKDNLFYGVFADMYPDLQEGYAAILLDIDTVYGHPVEWWIQGNNFAGAKKPLTGFTITTADGTYTTTAGDNFTYVMAAAAALEIRALESAVIDDNYFGGANRYGIVIVGKDRGGSPFNPFNIRIANNMFDPSLLSQIAFTPTVANCYAWDIIITGNTFIGDRNGRNGVYAPINPTTTTSSVIGLQVNGNTFNGHYGTPIVLDGATGFNIVGNTITDYNKLGAATTDTGYVCAVSVRNISSKGLVASNTIGGGVNFSDTNNCEQGVIVELSTSSIVQSGNHRVGTTNWTAQTYPA